MYVCIYERLVRWFPFALLNGSLPFVAAESSALESICQSRSPLSILQRILLPSIPALLPFPFIYFLICTLVLPFSNSIFLV